MQTYKQVRDRIITQYQFVCLPSFLELPAAFEVVVRTKGRGFPTPSHCVCEHQFCIASSPSPIISPPNFESISPHLPVVLFQFLQLSTDDHRPLPHHLPVDRDPKLFNIYHPVPNQAWANVPAPKNDVNVKDAKNTKQNHRHSVASFGKQS